MNIPGPLTDPVVLLLVLSTMLLALRMLFVPLAVAHEIRDRLRRRRGALGVLDQEPSISVIVPAYDEEAVLESCLRSILGCGYPDLEVIVVDDGSTDATAGIGADLSREDPRVRCIVQDNAGKGAALNTGIRASTGEILVLVDADTVFTAATVPELLRGFRTDGVGAVCGDDRPVNVDRLMTRFLALITHVGTGLVRRAFDILGVVPVVSGNCGAFRREALEALMHSAQGPVREDTLGEDLELTWRLHRSRWRVTFAPRALVFAESPSTLGALWRQRVRWARGLLQGIHLHGDALSKPWAGRFWAFMLYTLVTMVALPMIQVTALVVLLGWAVRRQVLGQSPLYEGDLVAVIGATGIGLSLILLVLAMGMSGSLRDLRHLWTVPLWPLYSTVISCTMFSALRRELGGAANTWDKSTRTGVISHERRTTLHRPTGDPLRRRDAVTDHG